MQTEPKIIWKSLAIDVMRQTAAGWYECEQWKKFVLEEGGVVDNLDNIILDAYFDYVDWIKKNFPGKDPELIIGGYKSPKCREFELKIIRELINPSKMDTDFLKIDKDCKEFIFNTGIGVIQTINF